MPLKFGSTMNVDEPLLGYSRRRRPHMALLLASLAFGFVVCLTLFLVVLMDIKYAPNPDNSTSTNSTTPGPLPLVNVSSGTTSTTTPKALVLKASNLPLDMTNYNFTNLVVNNNSTFKSNDSFFELLLKGSNPFKVFENSSHREDGCNSTKGTVQCCYVLPEVDIPLCLNFTYLPEDYGFNVTLQIGSAVFEETLSLRNPPPICLFPPSKILPLKLGGLCIRFEKIDVNKTHVHFCAKLIAVIWTKPIYRKELGCVDIPLAKIEESVKTIEQDIKNIFKG